MNSKGIGHYPMPYVIENTPNGERGYDMLSRLLKERIVILSGPVGDSMCTSITAQLLFLAAEDAKTPLTMYINSPGGIISSGLAIIDTMNHISPPVHTLCLGQAASMGAVILACGEKGSRSSLPHARIMIHQPSGGMTGKTSDIMIQAREMKRVKAEMVTIMAKVTGQDKAKLEEDIELDKYMTPTEAQTYGIVDEVLDKRR